MKKLKKEKPPFPLNYVGEVNAFPWFGGVQVPNLIASIPIYTLEKDPILRKELEAKYDEQKKKERDEGKAFYDGINVGDVYYTSKPDISLRISKLSIKDDCLYINLCASSRNKEAGKREGYKPLKSERWRLEVLQSLVKGKYITKLE